VGNKFAIYVILLLHRNHRVLVQEIVMLFQNSQIIILVNMEKFLVLLICKKKFMQEDPFHVELMQQKS